MNPLKAQISASVAAEIVKVFEAEGEEAMWDAIRAGSNFEEMLQAALRMEGEDLAMAQSLTSYIGELTDRRARIKSRTDRRRDFISALMNQAGVRKAELPEATLSLGNAPVGVRITDESALPDSFMRIKREPDKTAIKDALKRGEIVAGAELSNGGESLTVRRK